MTTDAEHAAILEQLLGLLMMADWPMTRSHPALLRAIEVLQPCPQCGGVQNAHECFTRDERITPEQAANTRKVLGPGIARALGREDWE